MITGVEKGFDILQGSLSKYSAHMFNYKWATVAHRSTVEKQIWTELDNDNYIPVTYAPLGG